MAIYSFKKEFFLRIALAAYNRNEGKRKRIQTAHEIGKELAIAEQILDKLEENKELNVRQLLSLEKKIKKMKKLMNKIEGKRNNNDLIFL